MQCQYAMANLLIRVWTTTQRWWEKTLLDVWKIKSSIIFQLAKEVLNRKRKDQKYWRFTVPVICLKVEREWLPVTTVVNGTVKAASIAWFDLRHGLTAITSGHVIFVSYYYMFLHIANIVFCSSYMQVNWNWSVQCMVLAEFSRTTKKKHRGPQFHGRIPIFIWNWGTQGPQNIRKFGT